MRFVSRFFKGVGLRGLAGMTGIVATAALAFAQAPATDTGVAAVAPPVDKAPKITVEEPVKDFGVLFAGTQLQHTFKIFNTGNADLKISKITPGCSCTVAGKYPDTLKPGESGEVPFTVNTSNFRGPFTRMPTIFSNDPSNPQLQLTLKGEAKRYVDAQPPSVSFAALGGKEPQVRAVKIVNNSETPLKITMQSPAQSECFKMALTEIQAGKEYELKVTAAPPWGEPGIKQATVVLQTSVEQDKQLNIPINGTLPIRIDIQPMVLRIARPAPTPQGAIYPPPLPQGGKTTTMPARKTLRIVRFLNNGDSPIKLTEVTTNDPAISASFREYQPGKMYLIQLEMPMDYVPPPTGRKLTIKTDDAEKPVVEVPITGEQLPPPTPLMPQANRPGQQNAQQPEKPQIAPPEMLVGKDIPAFTLTSQSGKPLSNTELGAPVVILDFFSPRCGFCRRQMPVVDKIRQQYEAKGVRFVFVGQRMGPAPTVEDCTKMMSEINVKGELALDAENKVGGEIFKAAGYPTMVILDKKGKVAAVNVGARPDLAERMAKQIDALLAGKPIPADALPPKEGAVPPPRQARTQAPAETLVGKAIPAFKLNPESGKALSNDNLGASVAVLDFFSPRCGFCRRQMPVVDKVRQDYEAKGVRFVFVGQRMGAAPTVEDCTKMMGEINVKGELALDPENKVGGEIFKTTGYPTMVILDESGKVAAVNIGAKADLTERMTKQLDALLAGKPIPADALPMKVEQTAKQ